MPNEEEKNIKQDENAEETNSKRKGQKKLEELQEALEKAKSDAEHWKNEYYRAYADTKNLRDSLEKDHRDAIKYRAVGFVEELLPVLDSFHVVLSSKPPSDEVKNYLVGFQFIYTNLLRVLENEGVKEIEAKVGDKFNANTMDAVDSVIEEPINIIKKVNANGYMLHDRLIRPAKVTVSIAKPEETSKEEDQTKDNETKIDA